MLWFAPDFSTAIPGSIEEIFLLFSGMSWSKNHLSWWQVLCCAVISCVWKSRNNSIFKQIQVNKVSLMEDKKFQDRTWLHLQVLIAPLLFGFSNPISHMGSNVVYHVFIYIDSY